MDNFIKDSLRLKMNADRMPIFFQLLEQGFRVNVPAGCSIRDILCQILDIDTDYLEDRIQTIFLNNSPIDDLETAVTHEGATLALSAAMPGLAGAILRKSGFYASMRSSLSPDKVRKNETGEQIRIVVKCFNLVARELGAGLLHKGVRIVGLNLQQFFARNTETFLAGCISARADGRDIEPEKIPAMRWDAMEIFLQIVTPSNP